MSNLSSKKLYAVGQRECWKLGDHYTRNSLAMTAEGLHKKSDIAAELGVRDAEIERLNALLNRQIEINGDLDKQITDLVLKRSAVETSEGYSQEYADKMRTALSRILGITGEPHQQGNREVQIQNISCIASDGLLGIERAALKATAAPRESDWRCDHCGRDNDPAETHCGQCEWSRKHTIAGVLHERACMGSPCRCGALNGSGAT